VLSARLAAVASDPEPVATVAARGRAFVRKVHDDTRDPDRLERLLKSVLQGRKPGKAGKGASAPVTVPEDPRFPMTQLAAQILRGQRKSRASSANPIDLPQARQVLAAVERTVKKGNNSLSSAASAVRLEIAIAEAEESDAPHKPLDPLFRLRTKRWALGKGDLAGLMPIRDPRARMMTFDASDLEAQPRAQRRTPQRPRPCHVVAFATANGERREPLFVSDQIARILALSDGTRTALEIDKEVGAGNGHANRGNGLEQIEELFLSGLLTLQDGQIGTDRINAPPPRQFGDSVPPNPANDGLLAGAGSAAAA
jgi:hypothetical protein